MKYYDLITQYQEKGFEQGKKINFLVGGEIQKNKAIARKNTQVLLNPFSSGKWDVDAALVQTLKDNDTAIGVSLRQFLETRGLKRIRLIVNYKRLIQLCLKKGVRILLVSDAQNEMQARTPLQLVSIGVLLGMTLQQAKWSISEVPEYLMEARK